MHRIIAIVVVGAVALTLIFGWFFGNFFYDLFWAFLEQHHIRQADVIAYTLSHIVSFLLACLVVAILFVAIRYELSREHKKRDSDISPSARTAAKTIEIKYGEDGPFERLLSTDLSRLERLLSLEFVNPYPDKTITQCKLEIINIEPFAGPRRPLVLRDNFTLPGGDHVFIPFVRYGESRSVDRSVIADTAIAVCAPEGEYPNFLAALPHDVENILTIRATAIDAAVCEQRVIVWVGAGTRLRIRKHEGYRDQAAYMPLEDAVQEAYGAARNTDIGRSAEKMNTNGVLAWFAYYYHTQEIPVFGNVRSSTRVEPVLFRNIDIKMEKDKLIAKEIYGDVIWENMQVKKSDHERLLGILRDHARALRDG
jgi:hypothetical protein